MKPRTTACEAAARAAAFLLALASGACATGQGPAAGEPDGGQAAGRALELHSVSAPGGVVALGPAERLEIVATLDEILSSPALVDPAFGAAVESWVRYWRGPAAEWLPEFLGRMGAYQDLVDPALAEAGLPASLRYLPVIESGYDPRASSRARAVGLWQFMEATARERGMVVSPLYDQRRDPVRSTAEAVAFLAELREEFGSWFWALAAYNSGPNRVRRLVRSHPDGALPTDSSFWALRSRLPRETRDYIPKLVAAVVVARGVDAPAPVATDAAPFRFEVVRVPDATTLDVVARAAAVPQGEIERLNPEYVRGMTPPGRESLLRVPEGARERFEVAYAVIPPEERVSFVEHSVAQGETLSHIALRYGVRVADLEAANPGVRARFLRVGRVLTVPVAPSARRTPRGTPADS